MKYKDLSAHKDEMEVIKDSGCNHVSKFVEDDKEYYFKQDTVEAPVIAEVFSSYFLEEMGEKEFVKYDFAYCPYSATNKFSEPFSPNNLVGTLSQSFLDSSVLYQKTFFDMALLDKYMKDGQIFWHKFTKSEEDDLEGEIIDNFTGVHFNSVQFVMEIIDRVCKDYDIKYDKQVLENRLIKMAIYDYFMANDDRNMSNIIFLIKIENGQKYCELAPMFDFGFNFGADHVVFDRKPRFISHFGLSKEGQEIEQYNENRWFKDGGIIVSDIMDIMKFNPEYKGIVDKCLNVDIQKMIEDFQMKYEFEMDEATQNMIKNSYLSRVDKFKEFDTRLQKRLQKSQKHLKDLELQK